MTGTIDRYMGLPDRLPNHNSTDGRPGEHSPFAQAFLEGLKLGGAKSDITAFAHWLALHTKSNANALNFDQEPTVVNNITDLKQPSLVSETASAGLLTMALSH